MQTKVMDAKLSPLHVNNAMLKFVSLQGQLGSNHQSIASELNFSVLRGARAEVQVWKTVCDRFLCQFALVRQGGGQLSQMSLFSVM
jgi:hypothetical protein